MFLSFDMPKIRLNQHVENFLKFIIFRRNGYENIYFLRPEKKYT